MRVLSPRIEPPETLDDGSIASTATRWPCVDQEQAERFDEGRLADAGDAGDAQAHRVAGVGEKRVEQGVGSMAVVGAGGFEERDGLGDGAALAGDGGGRRGSPGAP